MMGDRIKLGISSCLLGEKVRYNGGHQMDHYLCDTLGRFVDWVPVCPEVGCGLPVPREAMRLVGDPASPRLITQNTGIDHTDRMLKWAGQRLKQLEEEGLCGFIFKIRSPSSGMRDVKVYEGGSVRKTGVGIWAREFMRRFPHIPVEDDGRLHDPGLRENFIERVFVFYRWQEYVKNDGALKGLVAFHTTHKLLIMAHSPKAVGELGRLVARGKNIDRLELIDRYIGILLEALKLKATVKKNTNVLYHILGHFKKNLSAGEKAEMVEVINSYQRGLVPLIVPITLLRHYVIKYDEPYLTKQYYLHPHPLELMLRNHV
jgi:uncharacterized protein YbgA (DUF1722 family)/uncharacterized protein YbbK (DUF523 family)